MNKTPLKSKPLKELETAPYLTDNTCRALGTVLKPKIDHHSLFFAAQKKRTVIKSISAKLFF